MRTRVNSTGWIVAAFLMPVVAVIGFVFYIWQDMRAVEVRATECDQLIPALMGFQTKVGRYPVISEAEQISPQLRCVCHYQPQDSSFIFVLTGGDLNMQAYIYSSESAKWHWD